MAFPSLVGTVLTERTTVDATSYTPVLPTGISSGEALLALVTSDATSGASLSTSSSGWVMLGQTATSNGLAVQGIFWCADAASAAGLTVDCNQSQQYSSIITRISGHRTGENPTSTTTAAASSATVDPPSHSHAGGAAEDVLWLVLVSPDTSVTYQAAPTGYSGLTSRTGNGSSGDSSGWAWAQINAATENPDSTAAALSAARVHVVTTLSIRPEGALSGITGSGSGSLDVTSTAQGAVRVSGTGLRHSVLR